MIKSKTYPELDGIDYVLYYNDSLEKLCVANISDKGRTDERGYPWYEGCYGNCLIALKYQRVTDGLYLLSENTMKELISKGFLKVEQSRLYIKILLNHNADRFVETDERYVKGYVVKNNKVE